MNSLTALFQPASVAVIGASQNVTKLGHIVLKNIQDGGYAGQLYAINPNPEPILGVPTYASVAEIPRAPDMAVLAVPAAAVANVTEDCGRAGIKVAVILAAGFSELGGDGAAREAALAAIAQKYNMRLLGPNCLGLINPVHQLNASFAGSMPTAGQVAVLSQSGAMCTAILDWAKQTSIGFSSFVSVGNKTDLEESDLLETWREDEGTSVVLGYLEGISHGQRFLETASALTRRKPFILIKSGVSEAGAAAVSSHTGTLTGSDDVLEAALAKAGVLRAHTIEELFDYTQAFTSLPRPAGPRVAIVTNAGGPAVLTTDAVIAAGLEMAQFSSKTETILRTALPEEANVHNPVDCIGDARAARYQTALKTVLADPAVDAVLVLLTPQAMTEIPETAEVIRRAAEGNAKPIVSAFIGGAAVAPGLAALRQANLAAYETPERAVTALAAVTAYAEYLRQPAPPTAKPSKPKLATSKLLRAAYDTGQASLQGSAALALLEPYGISGPAVASAHSAEEAVVAAKAVGYPVAMKIDSPDILHKTDAGGVLLDLTSDEAVRDGYNSMITKIKKNFPQAKLRGVTVNHLVEESHDFIIGGKRDATFGPVVLFGYGGIYVEVFRDLSFGLAPLTDDQAAVMIEQTKSAALLHGARGEAGCDIKALRQALTAVSQLMVDFPQIAELDLNPIRVFRKGALSLDTRIILDSTI